MGKLSGLFGILAAILAIAAVVLSYLLFERRNEFRGRADKLALTVSQTAGQLDRESGTNVGGELTFTPATDTAPESGTLGWKAYQDAKDESGNYAAFQARLNRAVEQASQMNTQRNTLAATVQAAATDLGMSDAQLDLDSLKTLADQARFTRATERVLGLTRAVAARDESLVQALVRSGNVVGYNFQERIFRERTETIDDQGNVVLGNYPVSIPLEEFVNKVTRMNTRLKDYVTTLTEGIRRVTQHEWETKPELLADEREYVGALTSLQNDFAEINDQLLELEQKREEVARQKDEIKKLEVEVDDWRVKHTEAQDRIARLERTIEQLRPSSPVKGIASGAGTVSDQPVEGRVLQVNNEWKYVILDLGASQIAESTQMLVARDEELIAKILISRVLNNISIGEIVPEIEAGIVKVGDRVIMP